MKKSKLIKKQLIFLLVFSLSFFIFAGCQSKIPATTSKANTTNSKSFKAGAMKQKMKDSIKPLVANKTITQAQEDKIVAVLTPMNSGKNNENAQNKKSGQTNGTKDSKTNKQLTALTKLVNDKVITQVQADAVTKAIKANTPNMKMTKNS
jgi:hypothetical protein